MTITDRPPVDLASATGREKLLRDLSDEEFRASYDCDRFTAAVLASRFRYIISHVCGRFIEHAFSPVIRESTDMSATLTGPPSTGHAMPAVSQTQPMFYGSMPEAVRIALEEHGIDELEPGDVILVNDPYRVGTHLNDACFIRPAFHRGTLIGAVTIRAHMLDMGGIAVGGFEVTKQDLYQDGMVFPPTLLFHAGKPVRSTFNLLHDNTRFGPVIVPDIQTINSCLELGERLLGDTVEKYGYAAYVGGIRYACDSAAETMRTAIRGLPDGVYCAEELLDSDGLHDDSEKVVRVRINKRGPRIEFDLSGTSPANDTAVNCSWADAKTAVAVALKYLLDPRSPFTSGSMRDVDVILPPQSMINPEPPHTCQWYWEPAMAIIYATFRALNPLLGEKSLAPDSWGGTIHFAYGGLPDGTPWFSSALNNVTAMGPWGATRGADGDSTQLQIIINMIDGGCEAAEADTPVVILRHDHVPDTAGAGEWRSGTASISDSLWLTGAHHRVSSFHLRRPPGGGGVRGGGSGTLSAAWLWDGASASTAGGPTYFPVELTNPLYAASTPLMGVLDPVTQELDPLGSYHLLPGPVFASAGSVVRFVSNGAGGWGDPLLRDPQRVLADVRDEYVTIAGAARDYAVVVTGDPARDPEGVRVDVDATARLRASRRGSDGDARRAPETVAGIIRTHAALRGDRAAVTCDGRTTTFAELDERSDRVAQALAADGVGRGDRVAFLDTNSIEFFEALFGAAKVGAVLAAISWRLAPAEIAEIIDDSHAEIVIVGGAFADVVASVVNQLPRLKKVVVIGKHPHYQRYVQWVESAVPTDSDTVFDDTDLDDTVLQLYTSGTTGLPKGVMLTNRNLMTLAPLGGPTLALSDDSVNLVAMPLFHIGGSGYALAGMYSGCHTVLVRQADPVGLLDIMESARITNTFVVPAVLLFMLAAGRDHVRDFSSLRTVCYGGSPISADVLARSLDFFGCEFVQVYGLTETTGTVTLLDADDHRNAVAGVHPERLLSAGRPLDGVGVRVVSVETGQTARPGEVGEIWVRSPQVTPGYWGKPEDTAAVLPGDGWFRTGDAGYQDADGYVYVHDRIKDMIISGGENVFPAQVENVLMSHAAVADVAVIGVPSERWGETVRAVVVPAPGCRQDAEQLIGYCRERLAHYKCPTSVVFTDALPRNPSGKILKRELRAASAVE